jgi:DNA-binding response OmpR family regulator
MRRFVLGSATDSTSVHTPPETENKSTPERSDFIGLLIVSDDPMLSQALTPGLQRLGLEPRWAKSYQEALDQRSDDWQAVVLDLLVPRSEQYSICREARSTFGLPVFMVDERREDAPASTLGVDFYLDKPITAESIRAGLHALEVRQRLNGSNLPAGELVLFREANAAFVDGRFLDLTPAQFLVLERLAQTEGRAVSRSDLVKSIQNEASELNLSSVDMHVVRLMAKLATRSSRRIVRSAKPDCYMLREAQS